MLPDTAVSKEDLLSWIRCQLHEVKMCRASSLAEQDWRSEGASMGIWAVRHTIALVHTSFVGTVNLKNSSTALHKFLLMMNFTLIIMKLNTSLKSSPACCAHTLGLRHMR